MLSIMNNKTLPVIVAGLLFALILVSACTDTSQPPVSPAATQTTAVPLTQATSGTSGTFVTTEIPVTMITSGNPSCSYGQISCDGTCIDMQSDSQHCGACENACNTSEPCSMGTCLSWAGSWIDDHGGKYELTQIGTSVNGTDSYNQEIFSGSTSGNPPRLTGTWVSHGKISSPFTLDMASDGKSFSGGLLGKNIITWTRQQD
ncbi:MAG: Stigma-specific protein, Stig1 [Methanoregula sp.]